MADKFNMDGLRNLARQLRAQIGGPVPGPVDAMFKQWGARYLGFIRRRYVTNARGGGEWPDLAESTKRRRRKGRRNTGRFEILRDTGLLLGALTTGARGNFFRRIPGGIRVGFAGEAHDKRLTFSRLAMIHQTGAGNVPVRKILVVPDATTIQSMTNDARRAIQLLAKMK